MDYIDFTKVIAYDSSRPVPTQQQLGRFVIRQITPIISQRADGTLVFMGARNKSGESVDNDGNVINDGAEATAFEDELRNRKENP